MLIFDLQLLVFGIVLLMIAVGLTALALERWVRRRRMQNAPPGIGEMQTVWARAPFGLMVFEDERGLWFANDYARRLLNLNVIASALDLPDAEWVRLLDEDRVAARAEPATGRHRVISLDGARFARWWITPLDDRDFVFVFDDTAARRAEQTTREMLSDISHELRTPLATLLTHLEVLRLPKISDETRQQSIQLMGQETKRLTRLVNNLLELGRLESATEIERRPVDARALAEQVIVQITPQAEERQIALVLQSDVALPLVIGDADRVRQVFLNLLDNAIKFCRAGDCVTVALRHDTARGEIACAVRDTGPGIAAEHLAHIPRRFYRAAYEQIEGSGLGLMLVGEILRHHQSKLEIESCAEGETTGTSVRFTLPVLRE